MHQSIFQIGLYTKIQTLDQSRMKWVLSHTSTKKAVSRITPICLPENSATTLLGTDWKLIFIDPFSENLTSIFTTIIMVMKFGVKNIRQNFYCFQINNSNIKIENKNCNIKNIKSESNAIWVILIVKIFISIAKIL